MMKASVYGGRALNNFSSRVMDENLKDDGTHGDWNGISIASIVVLPSFSHLRKILKIYDILLLCSLPDRYNEMDIF